MKNEKRRKQIGRFLVLFSILFLFCSVAQNQTAHAATPYVTVKKKTVYLGNSYQLRFKNLYKNATVTYRSDNTKVAGVSKTGLVTPKARGTANITITIRQNSKTYTNKVAITVKKPYLSITNKKWKLVETSDYQLAVKAYGVSKPKLRYKSSNDMIARIDSETGMIHARSAGTVTITVYEQTKGLTASYKLKVEPKNTENQFQVYVSTADFSTKNPYTAPDDLEERSAQQKEIISWLVNLQERITAKYSITVQEMMDYYTYINSGKY